MSFDVDARKKKGPKGIESVRHWRAKKESRGRTKLAVSGGYMGTGGPMLGLAEEALVVFCAD